MNYPNAARVALKSFFNKDQSAVGSNLQEMLGYQKQNYGQKRVDDENPNRIIGNDKSVQKYEDTHAKLRGHIKEQDQQDLLRMQNLMYG